MDNQNYVDEIMDIVDNETGELDLEHQRVAVQQQIRKAQLEVLEEVEHKYYSGNKRLWTHLLRKINQLKSEQGENDG